MLLGVQTDRNSRLFQKKNEGVLYNITDTLSVTDVDTSLSEVRIRMSSSSTSPASFGPPPVILASLRLQSTRAFA